jgi:uncharacterized surface protein with fasciclin (FAS1) repeats
MTMTRLFTAAAALALMSGAAFAQTPSPAAPTPSQAAASTAAAPVVAKGDLIETATASGQFTTFLKAVEATNLTTVLKTQQGLTLFAPTDAAFAALPAGELDKLMLPENAATLQKVLTYHLINARVDSSKIAGAKGDVKTVEGSAVTLDGSGAKPMIDGAAIVQADVSTTNGVLHVIDKVLMPKDMPGAQASASLADPSAAGANPSVTPSAGAVATDASATVPMSSQSPEAQATLKAGDPNVVANPPVADTVVNRAKHGQPASDAGKKTIPKGN